MSSSAALRAALAKLTHAGLQELAAAHQLDDVDVDPTSSKGQVIASLADHALEICGEDAIGRIIGDAEVRAALQKVRKWAAWRAEWGGANEPLGAVDVDDLAQALHEELVGFFPSATVSSSLAGSGDSVCFRISIEEHVSTEARPVGTKMHHIFLMHFLSSSLFLASSFKPEFAPYIRFALSKAMAATSLEPLELSSKNLDALKDLVLAPKPSASLLKALSLPTARTGLPALADASHGGAHTRVVDEGAAGKRQRSWEGGGADAPQLQRIELRVARGRGGERRSEADGDGRSEAQELRRGSRARDPDIDYNLDTADGLGRQRDPSGGGLRVVFEGRSVLTGLARFLACGVLVDPPEEVAAVLRDGALPTDVVTVRPVS